MASDKHLTELWQNLRLRARFHPRPLASHKPAVRREFRQETSVVAVPNGTLDYTALPRIGHGFFNFLYLLESWPSPYRSGTSPTHSGHGSLKPLVP